MIIEIFERQRHRIFLWIPVAFGAGIGVYFAIPTEPSTRMITVVLVVSVLFAMIIRRRNIIYLILTGFLCLSSSGYVYAALQTRWIAAPVMTYMYYGAIEGRIVNLDRSASNSPRITLDQVYLPGISRAKTPKYVRVSLQGLIPDDTIRPGGRVTLTGSLSPPSPPVEPGGFDFRRMAWFLQLGGVGYTRNPVLPVINESGGFGIWLFTQRLKIANAIRAQLSGQSGAFAAAIVTGDRSEIDPDILANLRTTNLAHLLAISGLHMGLLSGFVFGLLRFGFALTPAISLRYPVKKFAATVALGAGLAYLALSGANVATQRAFIMTAVVLIAVLLDRPALTLRAVALAAMIVLLIKPYSLLEAGFQMSFAATIALIATYEGLRVTKFWRALNTPKWRFVRPIFALLLTSSVAGAATAPISAFYFNQLSQYGLVANLLSVPVMGLLVMPGAVLAAILIPFGLSGVALQLMGLGIDWILGIASFFASMENAAIAVKSGPAISLLLITLAGLFLFLWHGRARYLGIPVALIACIIWWQTDRPEILVSDDGRLMGLMTTEGRALSKPSGHSYEARIWLENDGDRVDQETAASRLGILIRGRLVSAQVGDWIVYMYWGKNPEDIADLCHANAILITSEIDAPNGACEIIEMSDLKNLGALSISADQPPQIVGSRQAAQYRPWGY